MRTPEQIVQGVLEWVLEADELVTGYDHITGEKLGGGLPDAMVDLVREEIATRDSRFPRQELQQIWLDVYALVVSIMVDNDDGSAAAKQLRRIQHELKQKLFADDTLGGRVYTISPYFNFDLSPPFVEYADGTKGREMRLVLSVAEPIEEA